MILYNPGSAAKNAASLPAQQPAPTPARLPAPSPTPPASAALTLARDPASIYLGAAAAPTPVPALAAQLGVFAYEQPSPSRAPPLRPPSSNSEDVVAGLFGGPASPTHADHAQGASTAAVESLGPLTGAGVPDTPRASSVRREEAREGQASLPVLSPLLAPAAQPASGPLQPAAGVRFAAMPLEDAAAAGSKHVLSGPTALQAELAAPAAPALAPRPPQRQQQQPYAGPVAVSPFPSELPQPSLPLFPPSGGPNRSRAAQQTDAPEAAAGGYALAWQHLQRQQPHLDAGAQASPYAAAQAYLGLPAGDAPAHGGQAFGQQQSHMPPPPPVAGFAHTSDLFSSAAGSGGLGTTNVIPRLHACFPVEPRDAALRPALGSAGTKIVAMVSASLVVLQMSL